MHPSSFFILFTSLFITLSYLLINIYLPSPYMDEIFHITQTQHYCNYNYIWNDKITTLPGLYMVCAGMKYMGDGISRLVGINYVSEVFCSVPVLRLYNIVWYILIVYELNNILLIVNKKEEHLVTSEEKSNNYNCRILKILTIVTTPFLIFFVFLFYTDIGGIYWVLLTFRSILKYQFYYGFLYGFISILFRQTNIIWILYSLGYSILFNYDKIYFTRLSNKSRSVTNVFIDLIYYVFELTFKILPILFLTLMFITFVYLNSGIVVGDRTNHLPGLHAVQLGYYLIVLIVFNIGIIYKALVDYFKSIYFMKFSDFVKWFLRQTFIAVIFSLMIHYTTTAHPFLLADNRHFTFYIWRYFLASNLRYFYAIPYTICLDFLFKFMSSNIANSDIIIRLQTVLYLIFVLIVLVPSPLIEFRYFLIPIVLFQLLFVNSKSFSFVPQIVFNTLMNLAIISMFIFRPYHWADGSIARIMF